MKKAYFLPILMSFGLATGLCANEDRNDNQLPVITEIQEEISMQPMKNQWIEKQLQGMNTDQLHLILNALHLFYTRESKSKFIKKIEPLLAVMKKKVAALQKLDEQQEKIKMVVLQKATVEKLKNAIAQYREIDAQIKAMSSYLDARESIFSTPIKGALSLLTEEVKQLQERAKLFSDYYQKVVVLMKGKNIDSPQYYTMIFSAEGIIPEENRPALPTN